MIHRLIGHSRLESFLFLLLAFAVFPLQVLHKIDSFALLLFVQMVVVGNQVADQLLQHSVFSLHHRLGSPEVVRADYLRLDQISQDLLQVGFALDIGGGAIVGGGDCSFACNYPAVVEEEIGVNERDVENLLVSNF